MERISFVNGKFLPHSQCFIHIEDRGFQLADGVYEVVLLKNNKLIDIDWHLQRLFRSLAELEIKFEQNKIYLEQIILELFAKNNLQDGSAYLQITRGTTNRQQIFPTNISPTITATISPLKTINQQDLDSGLSIQTNQDIRWQRCDIKSTSLIASCWIKQKAVAAGYDDAILIRDEWGSPQGGAGQLSCENKVTYHREWGSPQGGAGQLSRENKVTYHRYVTEATFANVFIVDKNDTLITRNADNFILQGITRNRLIELAKNNGIAILEKKFSVDELLQAKEVFLSSTTLLVRHVSRVNGQIIGDGKMGKISKKLLDLYNNFIN